MRLYSVLLIAIQVAFFQGTILSQWEQTALPDSGDVVSLLVYGDQLYAAVFNGGIYRSSDNGTNWVKADSGLPNDLVIELTGVDSILYAGTYWGGVYRSSNRGQSWTGPGSGTFQDIYALSIDSSGGDNARVVAAATGGGLGPGVFLSSDSGFSFSNITNEIFNSCNSPTCWVDALMAVDSALFAGTRGVGVYKSVNRGEEWTPTNLNVGVVSSFTSTGSSLFAGISGNPGGVFKSSVGGGIWAAVNSGLIDSYVTSLASRQGTVFVGTLSGGVQKLISSSTGWQPTGFDSSWVMCLAANDQYLFVGRASNGGVPGSLWRCSLAALVTGVKESPVLFPSEFGLDQNYPNPFNSTTEISFHIPRSSHVSLKIYNTVGYEVATLNSDVLAAGVHHRVFNANLLASGVYVVVLRAGGFSDYSRLVLAK